ncbi:type I secretion system permease/ATPase [Methylolobus aquaticus]
MTSRTAALRSGPEPDLRRALDLCRSSFVTAGFFSLFINLLLLLPSIYMMQVYDRVLASSSESTLMMLTLIAVFLYVVMGGLEWLRAQVLIVTSNRLDQVLNGRVFDAMFTQALASGGRMSTVQPLNDLLQLRQFLTGPGLFAFFDAPWMPFYLVLMFMFHSWFGYLAVISMVVLGGIAIWNEIATRDNLGRANQESIESNQFTQRNLRNAEVIEAMGMLPRMRSRWQDRQVALLGLQSQASSKSGLITSLSKTYRLTLQSLILALGAYLAIHREITPGLMIAGSILLGRALAPLDLMIANWRGFLQAREAYRRLDGLLKTVPERAPPMPLPEPRGEIAFDKTVITPPGAAGAVLKGITLTIEPGQAVGIIGPSAAGKSTLVRAMLGLYKPVSGSVRLDGAELDQWDREALGQHIGYLPQDVELLDGSISENIARFGTIDPTQVVAAAQAAGVHDMILRLPEGYETKIIGQGKMLSAGQQQRLGLARALYGSPKLLVLDEPNSNLDQDGENALVKAVVQMRQRGSTIVLVTHRPNILGIVDKILLLVDGQSAMYGPRDQVLAALQQKAPTPAAPAPTLATQTAPAG